MVPGRHTTFSNNQNASGKARSFEVGGYASEDQRQIPISTTQIDHIGSADIKCRQSWRGAYLRGGFKRGFTVSAV